MSSSARPHARGTRVLRGDLTAELLPAATVVPHESARRLLAPSGTPESADLLAAARAEAMAEGRAQGVADARAEAARRQAAAAERAAEALAAGVAQVGAARAAIVEEATRDALGLCCELLAVILGDEAVRRAVPPAEVLERALAIAPAGEDLVVRVPPGFPLDLGGLVSPADATRVRLVEDDRVESGGCVLEAGACRIDAQIATALGRVRAVLQTSGISAAESA